MLGLLAAMVRRDAILAARYPLHTAVTVAGPLVSIVFFRVLADYVHVRGGDSDSYFSFVVAGFVMSHYLVWLTNHLSRGVREEQTSGTLDELTNGSISDVAPALGAALFPVLEGLAVLALQLALAWTLGLRLHTPNWPYFIASVALATTAFLSLGFLSSAFVVTFKRGDPIAAGISATAYFLAGVFFPIEQLPVALRWLSYLLPVTYGVRGARDALLHGRASLVDLAVLAGLSVVGLPLALWCYRRVVARARRLGTLSQS